MLRAAIVLAALGGALAATAHAGTPSAACLAAKQKVAYTQTEINKANANLKNINITSAAGVVNPTRKKQLELRLKRLQADMKAAKAAQAKACKTNAVDLAAYNGNYGVNYGKFSLAFQVKDGNVSGDLVSTAPLNPETGLVTVQVQFAGAQCAAVTLKIDPKTWKVESTAAVKCTLPGFSTALSETFTGQRK